jgi:hypothetical protein
MYKMPMFINFLQAIIECIEDHVKFKIADTFSATRSPKGSANLPCAMLSQS